ncbi:hypothetical protein PR048_026574, partial [Dryococelus australis]
MQKRFHILVLTEANEKHSAHSYEKLLVRDLTCGLSAKPQRLQTCAYGAYTISNLGITSAYTTKNYMGSLCKKGESYTTHVHVKDHTSLYPFISINFSPSRSRCLQGIISP